MNATESSARSLFIHGFRFDLGGRPSFRRRRATVTRVRSSKRAISLSGRVPTMRSSSLLHVFVGNRIRSAFRCAFTAFTDRLNSRASARSGLVPRSFSSSLVHLRTADATLGDYNLCPCHEQTGNDVVFAVYRIRSRYAPGAHHRVDRCGNSRCRSPRLSKSGAACPVCCPSRSGS